MMQALNQVKRTISHQMMVILRNQLSRRLLVMPSPCYQNMVILTEKRLFHVSLCSGIQEKFNEESSTCDEDRKDKNKDSDTNTDKRLYKEETGGSPEERNEGKDRQEDSSSHIDRRMHKEKTRESTKKSEVGRDKQEDPELKGLKKIDDEQQVSTDVTKVEKNRIEFVDPKDVVIPEKPKRKRSVFKRIFFPVKPYFDITTQTDKLERKGFVLSKDVFKSAENISGKTEESFILAVEQYKRNSGKYRRGHVEFIETGLNKIKEYDLHKDLTMYKALFSLFPENAYIASNRFLRAAGYMPRQQNIAIQILQEIEENGLTPDNDIGTMIEKSFGQKSQVMYKFQRMLYWVTKFRYINPWPIPFHLPEDEVKLAALSLRRMAHDIRTEIEIWNEEDLKYFTESGEETFIASAQSPEQKDLLAKHPTDKPLYVVGGHYTYLSDCKQTYYVLLADPPGTNYYGKAPDEMNEEEERWSKDGENWNFLKEESSLMLPDEKLVHEQEDGTVLSMCITGTSSKNSLVTWLRCLEVANPKLSEITVVFKLQEPDSIFKMMEEEEKTS